MAFGLGLVLGPPLGGLLSSLGTDLGLSPNLLPGAAAAMLSATALLMAIFVLPESLVRRTSEPHDRRRWSPIDRERWPIFFRTREPPRSPAARWRCSCAPWRRSHRFSCWSGATASGSTAREVGYLIGLMGVVVVILQLTAIHRLARRFGDVGTGLIGAGVLDARPPARPLTDGTRER